MKWWNKKYGKDSICSITLCRIRPGKDIFGVDYCTKLTCGHIFYTKALYEWMLNCPDSIMTCPMCREIF